MPFNIGPGELILVLVIALIVVGPGRLPEVGSAIGRSIREFRHAASDAPDSKAGERAGGEPGR
jgi:sec-independent protein translocase protein TatA